MPRKDTIEKVGGPCVRQAAALQEILDALQSPNAGTRAEAVRQLCPCRTAWDVPVQRYVSAMRDDPDSSVRHEARHVLDEDSRWGERLKARRMQKEAKAELDGPEPSRHSVAWYKSRKPRHQAHHRASRFR